MKIWYKVPGGIFYSKEDAKRFLDKYERKHAGRSDRMNLKIYHKRSKGEWWVCPPETWKHYQQ